LSALKQDLEDFLGGLQIPMKEKSSSSRDSVTKIFKDPALLLSSQSSPIVIFWEDCVILDLELIASGRDLEKFNEKAVMKKMDD